MLQRRDRIQAHLIRGAPQDLSECGLEPILGTKESALLTMAWPGIAGQGPSRAGSARASRPETVRISPARRHDRGSLRGIDVPAPTRIARTPGFTAAAGHSSRTTRIQWSLNIEWRMTLRLGM